MLLGLIKQITDTGRTYTYKHLHKVRTTDREEWHPCLTGYSLGQQGFTCTWRAKQQYALWYLGTKLIVLLRMLQELYYLFQFLLGLISTSNIREMYLYLVATANLGTTAAKGHHLAAATLSLVHKEEPQGCQKYNRQQRRNQAGPPRWFWRILRLNINILCLQLVYQIVLLIWEAWHNSLKLSAIRQCTLNDILYQHYLGHLSILNLLHEIRIMHFLNLRLLLLRKEINGRNCDKNYQQIQCHIFHKLIQWKTSSRKGYFAKPSRILIIALFLYFHN